MGSKAKNAAQADRTRLLVHEDAVACLVAADTVAKVAPEPVLRRVRSILREATERIGAMASSSQPGALAVTLSPKREGEYFPREDGAEEPSAHEIHEAEAYWEEAGSQQTQFREEALAQIGPLLPPREVAKRLGVTRATVANWRSRGKVLGIRFDDHEYLFPTWQFVASPSEGERGVVDHLDEVILGLGDVHPWDKARYFLTLLPSLGNRRPIDVLRSGSLGEVELLVQLARQRGQLGS